MTGCPMHAGAPTVATSSCPSAWSGFDADASGLGPLVTPQDVLEDAHGCDAYSPREIAQLEDLARYITGYLVRSDPKVGRAGPVCPFTPGALRRRAMLLTAWRGDGADERALASAMLSLLDAFTGVWGPDDGHDALRSVSIVLPGMDVATASDLVQRVHDRLKPAFVSRGLMFGEFYPDCDAPGLHNPDFRPLRTPVPNLTIRPMTANDQPFLSDEPANLAAYAARFPQGPRPRPQSGT